MCFEKEFALRAQTHRVLELGRPSSINTQAVRKIRKTLPHFGRAPQFAHEIKGRFHLIERVTAQTP